MVEEDIREKNQGDLRSCSYSRDLVQHYHHGISQSHKLYNCKGDTPLSYATSL